MFIFLSVYNCIFEYFCVHIQRRAQGVSLTPDQTLEEGYVAQRIFLCTRLAVSAGFAINISSNGQVLTGLYQVEFRC